MFGPSAVTVALLVWTHRWPSPVPVLPVSVWVCKCVSVCVCVVIKCHSGQSRAYLAVSTSEFCSKQSRAVCVKQFHLLPWASMATHTITALPITTCNF